MFFATSALIGCAPSVPISTAPSLDSSVGSSNSSGVQTSASGSATVPTAAIPVIKTTTASLALTGTPPLASIGTTANIIIITATDCASGATIGPFAITVTAPAAASTLNPSGTANLTWAAPTLNTDGTPLTDLAGFKIHYGMSAAQLSQEVILSGSGSTTYVPNGLDSGNYYFTVAAFNSEGIESRDSNTVSKTF